MYLAFVGLITHTYSVDSTLVHVHRNSYPRYSITKKSTHSQIDGARRAAIHASRQQDSACTETSVHACHRHACNFH